MNLPFILNVLISVVFIYLILSLLASEIQELITTLLQWRAKHLKDSIESLISGGSSQEARKVKALMSNIYDDPLIKNINQEAHGLIATGFRSVTRVIFPGNRKGAFGSNQSTGPSYIEPETFSTVMLDRMGVNHLTEKLIEIRLEKFAQRIIGDVVMVGDRIEPIAATSNNEAIAAENTGGIWSRGVSLGIDLGGDDRYYHLVESFEFIKSDYRNRLAKLSTSIERLGESLDYFLSSYPEDSNDRVRTFIDRVKRDKLSLFGPNNERAWVTGGLEPTVADIAALVDKGSALHRDVKSRFDNLKFEGEALQARVLSRKTNYLQQCSGLTASALATHQPSEEEEQTCLGSALNELTPEEFRIYQDYQTYQRVDRTLDHLPKALKESLGILARRAQTRTQETGSTVQHFQSEISTWFDRSMGRTSGVYKRNAKGVALIIGLMIAMFTNSDTFHIFSRVSSDDSLRQVITDRASQIIPPDEPNSNASNLIRRDLNELKNQTQEVLSDIPLPITWNPRNLSQQLDCPYEPKTDDLKAGEERIASLLTQDQWNDLYRACLGVQSIPENTPVPMQVMQMIGAKPLGFLRMLSGWWISGVAIAMGAPFWFDLLGKIVNVRNAGTKPK
jgi:hypothetical protein